MTGYKIGMAEEAVIADLTAKLAECKAQKAAALRIAEQHSDVVNNMIQQLTESRAREARLREALNTTLGCVDVYYIPALKDEFALADAPQDDTALKEYRKKVLLEAAGRLDPDDVVGRSYRSWLRMLAEE